MTKRAINKKPAIKNWRVFIEDKQLLFAFFILQFGCCWSRWGFRCCSWFWLSLNFWFSCYRYRWVFLLNMQT
jgi:hypothetical protein